MNVDESYVGWEFDNRGKAVMVASHVMLEAGQVPEYLESYAGEEHEGECRIAGYLLGRIVESRDDSLQVHFGCMKKDMNVSLANVIQIIPDDMYVDPLTYGIPCLSGVSRRQ